MPVTEPVGRHEKPDLPDVFHERCIRTNLAGSTGGPPFFQKGMNLGLAEMQFSRCFEGLTCTLQSLLSHVLNIPPLPHPTCTYISTQTWTKYEDHIFKKVGRYVPPNPSPLPAAPPADNDVEMCVYKSWIEEVHDVGFAGLSPERRRQIPTRLRTISELSNLATKLIFVSTCQHSATHTEALDLYGFVPGVPAMMRAPPMTRRHATTKEVFSRTLPDQFPDAYYGSLATVLQIHRPQEV